MRIGIRRVGILGSEDWLVWLVVYTTPVVGFTQHFFRCEGFGLGFSRDLSELESVDKLVSH